VLVPGTILFQIEAHFFCYLHDNFSSKSVSAVKGKFSFVRRRVVFVVNDGIPFRKDPGHEYIPESGAVGQFEVIDLDAIHPEHARKQTTLLRQSALGDVFGEYLGQTAGTEGALEK
jgi:hypothetical protein